MSKIAVKKGLNVVRVMPGMCANLSTSHWLLQPSRHAHAAPAICQRKVEAVTFDRHTSHRVNRAESEEMTSREVDRRKGFWVLNGAANQQYFSSLTTYPVKIITQARLTNYNGATLRKIMECNNNNNIFILP